MEGKKEVQLEVLKLKLRFNIMILLQDNKIYLLL